MRNASARLMPLMAALALVMASALASAADYPQPKEGDWVARDFMHYVAEMASGDDEAHASAPQDAFDLVFAIEGLAWKDGRAAIAGVHSSFTGSSTRIRKDC